MIILLWAMDSNKLIGKDDALPWSDKTEMETFKDITNGKNVVVGKNTYESIPNKLIGRNVLVLSETKLKLPTHAKIVNLEKVIKLSKIQDVYICGGRLVYEQFIDKADKLIFSEMKQNFVGNVYFPEFDLTKYELISKKEFETFVQYTYLKKRSNE